MKSGLRTVEVWNLDGKLHHCAVNVGFNPPYGAIARPATAYAITMSNDEWSFGTNSTYPVTLEAGSATEPANAIIDPVTIGAAFTPDPTFLKGWSNSAISVSAANATLAPDGLSNTGLSDLEACWKTASAAASSAANPFVRGAAHRAPAATRSAGEWAGRRTTGNRDRSEASGKRRVHAA